MLNFPDLTSMFLLCLPFIRPLQINRTNQFQSLTWQLKLGNPFNEKHVSIEMLVGIDYNHSFFLDEIIKGNENYAVAINFYPG